jgi:hypothetical protein
LVDITEWRPIAVRGIGRLRLRLEDDVREDLGRMKIQNWSKMPMDREAWKRFVELAKIQRDVAPREDLKIDQPSDLTGLTCSFSSYPLASLYFYMVFLSHQSNTDILR